jgi:hypothetical protein
MQCERRNNYIHGIATTASFLFELHNPIIPINNYMACVVRTSCLNEGDDQDLTDDEVCCYFTSGIVVISYCSGTEGMDRHPDMQQNKKDIAALVLKDKGNLAATCLDDGQYIEVYPYNRKPGDVWIKIYLMPGKAAFGSRLT